MKRLGIRFDVIAKDDIYYVLFYDIDREIDEFDVKYIDTVMRTSNISYMLFTTKHGAHLIGLTPINHHQWAFLFGTMKQRFSSYYGGVIIRHSRKQDETQELIKLEEHYGEVISNLFNLYASRFGLQKKPWTREFAKYILQFEKYRSKKE